ncbi:hypothetical protein F5Y02DRAFT_367025 [Annulohypoxylon stygium]|nr:hypothetical protein F5Y02DRAFT_367025 [Annulohypoxylon stygium]
MYSKTIVALLAAALYPLPATQFSCRTRERWGFSPMCCMHIEGQIGINCESPTMIFLREKMRRYSVILTFI